MNVRFNDDIDTKRENITDIIVNEGGFLYKVTPTYSIIRIVQSKNTNTVER